MADDLSALLGSLQREGQVDSSGAFTLDIKNTLKKLSQFRLSDPRHYVLNLIACATARRASWIQVEVGNLDLRLGFDGSAFSRTELHNLFYSFYDNGYAGPGCSDLAQALLGSRAFDPKWAVFESWEGERGHFVQIYEDQLYIQELTKAPWKSTQLRNCFRLRETPVLFRVYESWWGPYSEALKSAASRLWTGGLRTESRVLQGRCGFGPALWLNGQLLQPPISGILNVDLVGQGIRPPLMERFPGEQQVECGLWGRLQFDHDTQRQLCWIVQGVAFEETPDSILPPGVKVQVYADRLSKDISQEGLVDNEVLQAARREVAKAMQAAAACILGARPDAERVEEWMRSRRP